MRPPTSSRTAAAARSVLLLLLVLGLLAFGLWRLLSPAVADDGPRPAAGAENGASANTAQLSGDDPTQAGLEGEAALHARAGAVPVGVRLAGPARLDGHVIERASGLGVGGVRVDLLPVPPVGSVFLGRMLRISGLPEMATRVKPIAVAETAPDGSYHFSGVRQGTWYIDARGPYHVPENVVRARLVASGGGGPLDLWVRAGGRVVGRVLLPDGRPAFGVTVELVPGPGIFIDRARTGDLVMFEQKADEKGAFAFEGIPAGAGYEVTAAGTGFALTHALDVTVQAGQDTVVTVQTRAGGIVSGRVLSAPKGEEAAGKPLAGAHLGAMPRGLRDLRCAEELLETTHCVTRADGRFDMPNVPAGDVDVVAIAPGHLPALGAHLAVADGARVETPDIVLHSGPLVSGRVVDSAGAPVAGAQVRWNMVDWQNFQFDFSLAPMMAQAVKGFEYPTSDADGRFQAGPCAGKAPFRFDFNKLGFQDAHVDWNPDKEPGEITVTLHRGSAVQGIVMDEAAAEPVTVFTIATNDRVDSEPNAPGGRNPFTGGVTFEDPAGRFQLDALQPGKVRLVFSSPGYQDRVVDDLVIVEGQPTKGVIVRMQPGGTIRGVVLDPEEHPIPGAQVAAFPTGQKELTNTPATRLREERKNGGLARGARMPFEDMVGDMPPGMTNYFASLGLLGDKAVISDGKGAFELRGVRPGEVRVLAFQRDFASGNSGLLTLAEGVPLEGVKIVMNRGGGIEGKVVDRRGRAVPGSIVVAVSPAAMGGGGDPSGGALYQGQSSVDGAYAIRHVLAGSYFLVATRGDEALNPASFLGNMNFDLVTVPAGETVHYDVLDSSAGGCRVYGTISCNGTPVQHGSLTAVTFESESMLGVDFKAARIKEGGTFEFPGLAPGEYQLNLDGNGPQVRMRLEVPDEAELRADLHCPEGGAQGTVVDAATGTGIKGVEVLLRPVEHAPKQGGLLGSLIGREGASFRDTTNDQGAFQIERLPAGEYELLARPRAERRASYAPADPTKLTIDEDRVARGIEIKLLPALVLAGTVKDGQGAALPGVRVIARGAGEGGGFDRAETDKDGHFELHGLAPGKYELVASKDDYADTYASGVELERGVAPTKEIELVLGKGVQVTARVYGPDGRPAAGARARLVRKGSTEASDVADAGRVIQGLFSGEGSTDAEGRVVVGRYQPGEYRLEVQRAGSRVTVPDVKVPSGTDEHEVRAELPQ